MSHDEEQDQERENGKSVRKHMFGETGDKHSVIC